MNDFEPPLIDNAKEKVDLIPINYEPQIHI